MCNGPTCVTAASYEALRRESSSRQSARVGPPQRAPVYGLRSSKSSGIAMGSPMRTGAVRFVIDSSRPPDLRVSSLGADAAAAEEGCHP